MTSTGEGALVANPGAIPEMPMIAAGLARRGRLRAYVAPFGSPPRASNALSWAPVGLRVRVERELKRRELPPTVSADKVHHVATVLESLTVAAQRGAATQRVASALIRSRNAVFDAGVARLVDPSDAALVAVAGSAERSLRACRRRGVRSFLECPIAHHRFAATLLHEEARRVPDYAETLQFHRVPVPVQRRLERELELADRILVLSSFQKRTFAEEGVPEEKLAVTPLGVDCRLFRPLPCDEDRAFRVLFTGQLSQRKGLSYLVGAFRKAALIPGELLLVGRIVGSDRPWRGAEGIQYLPHVARWELPAVYAEADVFVLPSLVEGFPQTALEAMACGIPVIVSEHTFGTDVVTDGVDGYVVPIRDEDAIADRLRHLYAHPDERRRMGAAARATAEQFSWDAYGDRIAAVVTNHG